MYMRAGMLAISLGLGCGVLAADSPAKQDEPVASWAIVEGPGEGQVESAGVENRILFVPYGKLSPTMEDMRARLADPEQRKAMRAEHRNNLEHAYPDIDAALNLDSSTHDALMDVLANQYVESLDAMLVDRRGETWPSLTGMAAAENRKLEQLREVLGEDRLERYQEYSVTVHERGQVREVNAYLGTTDKLSPEQQGQLVKLFRERNQMPLPPPRAPDFLRSRDPNSPTFREDMQRDMQRSSELATIESSEQMLRHRETSNRWMAERASGFLSPAQNAALAKVNDADLARQRKWIEQARVKAGLDPAIPERQDEESGPARKPATGEVRLDLLVRVNGGEPVQITHTGRNGEPLKFKLSEDLFAEAEWTLFDDNWIDVRLAFFEEGPKGLRRLQGGLGSGSMITAPSDMLPGDNSIGSRGGSSTIVMGRKAYSVELSANAAAL